MGFVASRLHLRLFIDGLEVPVIGARCTYTEGAPATAQVQVIATDPVYDLLPRSLITLFYYENYDYERDNEAGTASTKKYGPQDLRRWKLLFMGELTGVTFSKQSGQRACTLLCSDPTNYWDFIKQSYVNFANGGVELFENAFMGVKIDRIKNYDVTTKDAVSNLYVWLTQSTFKDEDGEEHASIYLGVQRALREMFFASSNFYSQAFNRLRLGDQVVGLAQDKTAGSLFKLDFFEKFIKNQVGGQGGMVSMRQLVETLLGTVFHTYVTVPCPKFDVDGASKGFSPDPGKHEDKEISDEIIDRETYPNASLNYTVIKPDTWFLSPPMCNVVFPHQYNSIDYQRNFLQEPTRLFMRTSLIFTGRDKWLTERFYAPDFEAFNQLLYAEGGYLKRMATVLLPHEEFVGLNPVEAWQEDLGAFVQKGARREYLARLSDYLFWKYRFSTRTVNVSMPFNPNLLPGYPALVMDRVGAPGTISRHFMGNVQTLVHSVDQTGGWSHMTMVAARTHDEHVDFDGNARSLEEVTSRGTDGFLDDRYDQSSIGEQVYQPLFGIGSLYDLAINTLSIDGELKERLTDAILEALPTDDDLIQQVAYLQSLYQTAVANSADINAFTMALTQRPKANFTDIMGVPDTSSASTTTEEEAAAIFNLHSELDKEGKDPNEGFMSVAVDPEATDHNNDSYVSKHTTYRTVENPDNTITKTEKVVVGTEIKKISFSIEGDNPTISVPTTKETVGSYGLKDHLERRQEKVLAYRDSLKFRGQRG